MENIENEMKDLKIEVCKLISEIHELKKTCGRMDDHVSFVEKTYTTLRAPLEFIRSRLGSNKDPMPQISDN